MKLSVDNKADKKMILSVDNKVTYYDNFYDNF